MKILEDGTKYEGLFINGIIEGKGIYTFTDGSKWEGNSIKGKKEGKVMEVNGKEIVLKEKKKEKEF